MIYSILNMKVAFVFNCYRFGLFSLELQNFLWKGVQKLLSIVSSSSFAGNCRNKVITCSVKCKISYLTNFWYFQILNTNFSLLNTACFKHPSALLYLMTRWLVLLEWKMRCVIQQSSLNLLEMTKQKVSSDVLICLMVKKISIKPKSSFTHS